MFYVSMHNIINDNYYYYNLDYYEQCIFYFKFHAWLCSCIEYRIDL